MRRRRKASFVLLKVMGLPAGITPHDVGTETPHRLTAFKMACKITKAISENDIKDILYDT